MLGYDVDFGHMEIISLLTSTKFSEKLVGYVATTLLTRASAHHMRLYASDSGAHPDYHHQFHLPVGTVAEVMFSDSYAIEIPVARERG